MYTYATAGNERDAEWVQKEPGKSGVRVEVRVVPIEHMQRADIWTEADLILAGELFAEDLQWDSPIFLSLTPALCGNAGTQ